MAESGVVQAVVIMLGVFAVVLLCSLFKSRPRPEALTGEQLDEIRIRREAAKEASSSSVASTTAGGYTNHEPTTVLLVYEYTSSKPVCT